jgi:E3 ubiquitin-protein ligase DOA10
MCYLNVWYSDLHYNYSSFLWVVQSPSLFFNVVPSLRLYYDHFLWSIYFPVAHGYTVNKLLSLYYSCKDNEIIFLTTNWYTVKTFQYHQPESYICVAILIILWSGMEMYLVTLTSVNGFSTLLASVLVFWVSHIHRSGPLKSLPV